jgi:two-component system, OmpR family, alkaline phosphatase synthesis response regulator PhoP
MSKSSKAASKSVLIVEDNEDFCNLLKFIVEDDGYEGLQFPIDRGNIVEWAKSHDVVAVLMDLTLRRKPGIEYIEELKADKETKHIPILIITGRELSQREVVAFQLRDISYLRKGRMELDDIRAELKRMTSAHSPKGHAKKKEEGEAG